MILVKDVQPLNAELPILVTLSGIVIFVKDLQPLNAALPILVTLFGITVLAHPVIKLFFDVLIIALQLFLLSYFSLFSSTNMLIRFGQLPKAKLPILVTLSGIVILVKDIQLENARSPILVTLFGIVTLVKDVQPENA